MKKNLMKKAHELTKKIVAEYGDVDYRTQLGLCLSFLSQEEGKEMKTLSIEKWILVNKWDVYSYFKKTNGFSTTSEEYYDCETRPGEWIDINLYINNKYVGGIEKKEGKWGLWTISLGNMQDIAKADTDAREKIIEMFEHFNCLV